ncbi:hypothetical protein JM80_1133 [Cellulophaga sp. RHA_52]|uniref:hypothetical protein n=1 Tax=Cellulophaga sp. RHA_52 TaxID=1250036 RepID=UPI00119B731A|nr:hypothetical protein [Cellulophaga sp. RHA_52]TVZ08635.1 hypothetical protein JM80_1133 [Cellulophaga sp. RHA_52]
MTFDHSNKYLKQNLIFGLLQIGIGIVALLADSINAFFQYGWLMIGIFTLYRNYRERVKPYLILKNNLLSVQKIFGYRKINLSEFSDVEKTKNSLVLFSGEKKRRIGTWPTNKKESESLYAEIDKILTRNKKKE